MSRGTDARPDWEDFRRWLDPNYQPKKRARAKPELPRAPIEEQLPHCDWTAAPYLDTPGSLTINTSCKHIRDLNRDPIPDDNLCPWCKKNIITRSYKNAKKD